MIPQDYFEKVKKYFNDDINKTWTWFKTPNPGLAFLTPLEMIKVGKVKKLQAWIDSRLKGHSL